MEPRELVIGVVAGAVGLVFGLVPGLFSGLRIGVRNFHDALSFGVPAHPHRLTEAERLERPFGLAIVGALIVVLTVAAYVTN